MLSWDSTILLFLLGYSLEEGRGCGKLDLVSSINSFTKNEVCDTYFVSRTPGKNSWPEEGLNINNHSFKTF